MDNLCAEIRDKLVATVAENGGHLSANLGVVELTVALHRCFNSPEDSIVFDVGHQCYTHKILTGRNDKFHTLRTEDGISGFLRPDESSHDKVISGHAGTSVSSAYGINVGNRLQGKKSYTVAVVGDGAFTNGMIYEALNNAGKDKNNFIVILNDNKMSISKNTSAIARHLATMRSKKGYFRFKNKFERIVSKIPFVGRFIYKVIFHAKQMIKNALYNSNMFESLGFQYMGPVDGHDLKMLEKTFETSKEINRPVLVHVKTVKGKGYQYAEEDPCTYHGISGFDEKSGISGLEKQTYSSVLGYTLCSLAEHDEKICAITAAMCEGTGLNNFSKRYKNRFFDVGIAEEHAVTFGAGLAVSGMKPVVVLYSTFLQRSYDQILHDAAIGNVPLTLCIDRAGLVGSDGETHQGLFDVAFLSEIPGVKILSPSCYDEFVKMLNNRMANPSGVCAVRYPRGAECTYGYKYDYTEEPFFVKRKTDGNAKTAVVTYGRLYFEALKAADMLYTVGAVCDVVKINRLDDLSFEYFKCLKRYDKIFFYEEGIKNGGVGERTGCGLAQWGYNGEFRLKAINGFVAQADVPAATKKYGLDAESMKRDIIDR